VSQYLHGAFEDVGTGRVMPTARALLDRSVCAVIEQYAIATRMSGPFA
jgi:tagatose-1,6-bisphosphate aldolase non-catalytic subunit AgaZ/GatZ